MKDNIKNSTKGFSMVELIVVIAIMAVLGAVVAPSLIGYVENSRAQKDDSAMHEVDRAFLHSISANDKIYDEIFAMKNKVNEDVIYITFYPDEETNINVMEGKFMEQNLVDVAPLLANSVKQTVDKTVDLTSATYRHSPYTIAISIQKIDKMTRHITVEGTWGDEKNTAISLVPGDKPDEKPVNSQNPPKGPEDLAGSGTGMDVPKENPTETPVETPKEEPMEFLPNGKLDLAQIPTFFEGIQSQTVPGAYRDLLPGELYRWEQPGGDIIYVIVNPVTTGEFLENGELRDYYFKEKSYFLSQPDRIEEVDYDAVVKTPASFSIGRNNVEQGIIYKDKDDTLWISLRGGEFWVNDINNFNFADYSWIFEKVKNYGEPAHFPGK